MHLSGLTGGIASGKSAVAARLRARGVPVLDADVFAREAVSPGSPALAEIAGRFGQGVLKADGALDRKALAALVFGDSARRRELEGITHPRITGLLMQRVNDLAGRAEPLACYDAALIVETGAADAFRPLIVVAAPESLQLERALCRDGGTAEQTLARIRAQMPLAEKVKVADHVIQNTGTLEELGERADAVLLSICAELSIDPARYPLALL